MHRIKNLIRYIDIELTRAVQADPTGFGPSYAFITHLGDGWVVVSLLVLSGAILWLQGNLHYLKGLGLAVLGVLAIMLLKEVFRRDRPKNDYAALQHGYSFPSGHTGSATIVYGLLAFLLYSHIGGFLAMVGIALCLLLIVLVGFSRVYLGAHFPTDVLASWIIGSVMVVGIINFLQP